MNQPNPNESVKSDWIGRILEKCVDSRQ
jgi:hypothetical protein